MKRYMKNIFFMTTFFLVISQGAFFAVSAVAADRMKGTPFENQPVSSLFQVNRLSRGQDRCLVYGNLQTADYQFTAWPARTPEIGCVALDRPLPGWHPFHALAIGSIGE